jgi:MOSC domain-containing protein YiiM
MSDQATLQGIAVRGASRAPMREVQEASVTVTDGIVEDYRGTGLRQVTFIDAGQWRQVVGELGVDLPWHTRRANLLVGGLDLPGTVGSRLRIGDCLFEIQGETEPCERMNELQAGLRAGLAPEMRGGVWGKVLESGHIRVGQSVEIEE